MRVTVGPEGARLGRSSKNDIILLDPLLSRHHCRLFFKPGEGLWLTDLGSANQTFVNAKPVQEVHLKPGDKISVGDTSCAFFPRPSRARRKRRPPRWSIWARKRQARRPRQAYQLADLDPRRRPRHNGGAWPYGSRNSEDAGVPSAPARSVEQAMPLTLEVDYDEKVIADRQTSSGIAWRSAKGESSPWDR